MAIPTITEKTGPLDWPKQRPSYKRKWEAVNPAGITQ